MHIDANETTSSVEIESDASVSLEKTQHIITSIYCVGCQVSSVTERDRVYGWLGADDRSAPESEAGTTDQAGDIDRFSGLLSTSKLSQTVGYLALQVAAKLRAEAHLREAYDMYRYALGIFEDHPPGSRRFFSRICVHFTLRDLIVMQ